MNQKKKIRKCEISKLLLNITFFLFYRADVEELKKCKESVAQLTAKIKNQEVSKRKT